MPSKAETNTVEPVVAAESVCWVELLDRGVDCAMGVAGARVSADLVPPSTGMAETEAKRCQRQERSTRGRYSLRWWRRKKKHERRISPGEQKGRQSYTWLVCATIVKCCKGEKESTQGSMFSAGHEPTQDSAFGERHESTKTSASGAGHESTQSSAFDVGHESTPTDPWDRRGRSAQPAGP